MPLFFPRPSTVWDPPTTLDHLLSSPVQFVIHHVYALFLFLRGPAYSRLPHQKPVRVVCISDTHCLTKSIPPGDLLIHAGDLTNKGTLAEIQTMIDWLKTLPHPEKIAIAGNHDSFFDTTTRRAEDRSKSLDWGSIHYLEHNSVELTFDESGGRTFSIYGAPQIPQCGGSDFAFQYKRGKDYWTKAVPQGTDILVTHTPPKYHLDLPVALGDEFLLRETWRVKPTLHVFGHVHSGHGIEPVYWDQGQKAYERVRARQPSLLWGVLDLWAWLDVLRVIWYGVQGLLWKRVWGGATAGGWMVNAALVFQSTGKLANSPIVMDI